MRFLNDNRLKKHLSLTLLFFVYLAVLVYLSRYV